MRQDGVETDAKKSNVNQYFADNHPLTVTVASPFPG